MGESVAQARIDKIREEEQSKKLVFDPRNAPIEDNIEQYEHVKII